MTEVLERPDVIVELDVDLDIVPACEGTKHHAKCPDEAEWACRTTCDTCGRAKLGLYCQWHRDGIGHGGYIYCRSCNDNDITVITEHRL